MIKAHWRSVTFKGQFAILEVIVSSLLLLSFIGVSSAIFLSYSLSGTSQFPFLGFDFFATVYRNQTMSSCASSPSSACLPVLAYISEAYKLSYFRLSSGNASIAYGSRYGCLHSYYACAPFRQNLSYYSVCIYACSG